MVINSAIVIQSTRESEYYRHLYGDQANLGSKTGNGNGNISPKRDRRVFSSPYDDSSGHHPRYRTRKAYDTTPGSENSPYTTDTDGEKSPVNNYHDLGRYQPRREVPGFLDSPMPSMVPTIRLSYSSRNTGSWNPSNIQHPHDHLHSNNDYQTSGPSPWLSAIPRSTTTPHRQTSPYPSPSIPNLTRSQPYPSSSNLSQSRPQSQSHSQTQHQTATAVKQLLSPSDRLPHLPRRVLHNPLRTRRPMTRVEDEVLLSLRHNRETFIRQSQVPHDHHKESEGLNESKTIQAREDDNIDSTSNARADKKAALLYTAINRCVGGDGSRGGSVARFDGYNPRLQTGTQAAILIDGHTDEPLPETPSPPEGAFPRIKRVRSNSM
ncbi:hypothetical protein F4802DRAFT_544471 [Xylaria palmicola]|nr:hypothetical protein F4802DRAFT_544471 [Xylaria palmicola]